MLHGTRHVLPGQRRRDQCATSGHGVSLPKWMTLEPALKVLKALFPLPLHSSLLARIKNFLAAESFPSGRSPAHAVTTGCLAVLPQARTRQKAVLHARPHHLFQFTVRKLIRFHGSKIFLGHVGSRHTLVIRGQRHWHAELHVDRQRMLIPLNSEDLRIAREAYFHQHVLSCHVLE